MIIVFGKGGRLLSNLTFYYNDIELDIVESTFNFGVVFYTGGSFSSAQSTLAGEAKKHI